MTLFQSQSGQYMANGENDVFRLLEIQPLRTGYANARIFWMVSDKVQLRILRGRVQVFVVVRTEFKMEETDRRAIADIRVNAISSELVSWRVGSSGEDRREDRTRHGIVL